VSRLDTFAIYTENTKRALYIFVFWNRAEKLLALRKDFSRRIVLMETAFSKMFSSMLSRKKFLKPVLITLTAFFAAFVFASETQAKVIVEKKGNLGVIKGVVRDESGKPIADAFVAIFRVGTSELLKQVRSTSNGSFLTKIIPGTYTVLAIAQGYNAVRISTVQVNPSAELVYGFKLERAGSGNTLPEKRADRNSSKWRIQAAQVRRSIYQNQEDETPIAESDNSEVAEDVEETSGESITRRGQTVVETYFAASDEGSYTGVNFATFLPVSENAEVVIAGQTGTSQNAPNRFETNFKFRPDEKHQIRLNSAFSNLGKIETENQEKSLGQISFQATDEWRVSEGIVLVFGLDYSRFVGAGNDFSISPRLGFQYDINSKTRFRSAYTSQTQEQSWQKVIELEDAQVIFREPVAVQDFVVENDKPLMNKSSRLEFGIERVLDNNSNLEANIFFDTVSSRGVGLTNLPFDTLSGNNFSDFVANQQGKAQGFRLVYNRRLNENFSTSAGYAFGNGQKLSEKAITNPSEVFENDFFQTFFGQFDADFNSGTNVKTIFRFSPQATVFAIDPFQGRLAIYDPSLSILVTQALPTLGLPIRAEAIIDARNLLDFQSGINGEEGSLKLNSGRRILRGGILVRF
jgi:Carboxypeptidase regulatory-like domain